MKSQQTISRNATKRIQSGFSGRRHKFKCHTFHSRFPLTQQPHVRIVNQRCSSRSAQTSCREDAHWIQQNLRVHRSVLTTSRSSMNRQNCCPPAWPSRNPTTFLSNQHNHNESSFCDVFGALFLSCCSWSDSQNSILFISNWCSSIS